MDQGIDDHKLGREDFEKQSGKWKAEAGNEITQADEGHWGERDWSRESLHFRRKCAGGARSLCADFTKMD